MQEIPAQEPMKQWTLMAVHALGGIGHNREIEVKVRQLLNLSDDVSDHIYHGSRQTVLDHRIAFARSHLKTAGLLDNPQRSVWALTDAGGTLVNEIIGQMNSSAVLFPLETPLPDVETAIRPAIPNQQPCPAAPPHPYSNTYHIGDALAYMQSFPDGAVAGIATSPPYNKAFRHRGGHKSNWPNSKLMADNYAGYDDDLPPAEYVRWQRAFLTESLRLVGPDGVILYNIGRQIANLGENRRQEIIADFPVRQTIIWNRGSSNNQGGKVPTIFPPIYEFVYIIAGRQWRLPKKWLPEMRKWGDVWNINFETGNPHPAPFPVKLAERMVKTIDGPVLDPFAGSGTIGIAATQLGYPYYLNDISPAYQAIFQERLNGINNPCDSRKLGDR